MLYTWEIEAYAWINSEWVVTKRRIQAPTASDALLMWELRFRPNRHYPPDVVYREARDIHCLGPADQSYPP